MAESKKMDNSKISKNYKIEKIHKGIRAKDRLINTFEMIESNGNFKSEYDQERYVYNKYSGKAIF